LQTTGACGVIQRGTFQSEKKSALVVNFETRVQALQHCLV
jgi:hypothetical protein